MFVNMDISFLTDYPILPLIFTLLVIFVIYVFYTRNKKDIEYINENSDKKCSQCNSKMTYKGRNWVCPNCNNKESAIVKKERTTRQRR